MATLLPRVLEPEVMDTAQEAADYDAMDHAEVNARFCDDLLADRASLGHVLDVGTGPGLIPIALAGRAPDVTVEGIDLAEHMLALARRNIDRAGLSSRLRVSRRDAKATGWPDGAFDVVISNSIIHHIPDPADALRELWRLLRPGGWLFVRDLERPRDDAAVASLVALHAAVDPSAAPATRAMQERQRDLFEASLRAALTSDEVRAMVASLGVAPTEVRATSDRHWTLSCGR